MKHRTFVRFLVPGVARICDTDRARLPLYPRFGTDGRVLVELYGGRSDGRRFEVDQREIAIVDSPWAERKRQT